MNSPLVVIVGPTASGKSALAMQVARQHNGEIICADSRTVYVGADIGTAKPTSQDRREVPHYLLDLVKPNQQFTAAEFKVRAERVINDITNRGKIPILVGGTGLYVDAIIFDYQFGEPADAQKRAQMNAMTVDELQEVCRDNDIEIPSNAQNKRHLMRAIELGGLPKRSTVLRDNTIVVGLSIEKDELRKRVIARADAMIDDGIVQEVKTLAQRYGWDAPVMSGNIYRIFRPVIEDNKDQAQAVDESITSDMQLAKRQLTWLKRNPYIKWGSPQQLEQEISKFLASSISV